MTQLTDQPGRHRARAGHRHRGYEYRGPLVCASMRTRHIVAMVSMIVAIWMVVILWGA